MAATVGAPSEAMRSKASRTWTPRGKVWMNSSNFALSSESAIMRQANSSASPATGVAGTAGAGAGG